MKLREKYCEDFEKYILKEQKIFFVVGKRCYEKSFNTCSRKMRLISVTRK
jgi:hypothetical protein